MKGEPHYPSIQLCSVAFIIISEAEKTPEAAFKVEAIFRAAETNRLLDFIAEITGQDASLSWITIDKKGLADINERLSNAVYTLRDDRAPAPNEQPWLYLLSAVLVALQRASYR